MAKVKNMNLVGEEERHEYDVWSEGTLKNILTNDLHEHPENYSLVGHIDDNTRNELKEDIKINGIREPLQVWYNDNKLVVVSGHERLSIAKELNIKTLPCVKVEFKTNDEVLRFIFAVNKHRKQVKLTAPELLEKLFPIDKYPLLYADIRGNISTGDSKRTQGTFTAKDREKQQEIKEEAAEITGFKRSTVDKARKEVRAKNTKKKPVKIQKTIFDGKEAKGIVWILVKYYSEHYLNFSKNVNVSYTTKETRATYSSIYVNEKEFNESPEDTFIKIFNLYLLDGYKKASGKVKKHIEDYFFQMSSGAGMSESIKRKIKEIKK